MAHEEDLDFEISFYEEILKGKPDFVDVLTALGAAYTKKRRYQDGLKVDLRLAKLRPDEPAVHYNLACSYSLLEMADPSLKALKKAIQLGYDDFVYMENDQDLQFIRQDPRYRGLLSEYSRK